MDWAGKRVVITGGNSGIGRAAALDLTRRGARVAVLARDPARNEAVVTEMKGAGGVDAMAVPVDVTDDPSVQAAADRVLQAWGGVDVLIVNAGYARAAAVTDHDMAGFVHLMETNFFGHVRVVKAFLPGMKAQRGGHISVVTSMLGFMSFYGYAAYSASKFASTGFAEALRQEALPYGITVGVFYPPTTDTPGLASENETKPPLSWAIEGTSRKFPPEDVAAALRAGIESGRFVSMVGTDSWAIYYLSRWFPGLVRWVLDREVHGHVKKHGPVI